MNKELIEELKNINEEIRIRNNEIRELNNRKRDIFNKNIYIGDIFHRKEGDAYDKYVKILEVTNGKIKALVITDGEYPSVSVFNIEAYDFSYYFDDSEIIDEKIFNEIKNKIMTKVFA